MSQPTLPVVDLQMIARTLVRYPLRWIVPTVVITTIALGYAVTRTATWESKQALLVRDEAIGSKRRPGEFDGLEAMKTAQETVLELAKSRGVVWAALAEVGSPPSHASTTQWPTAENVSSARKSIHIAAPNGSEFGQTEVFYIKVKHQDKSWSVDFTKALCEQLATRLQELRDHKAQSLVNELSKTVALAQADLNEATQHLSAKELEVGIDLAELRILNESTSGESDLRRTLIDVKDELRQARHSRRLNEQLLTMLIAAQQDPSQLIATPNQLLVSQPSLRQLKDGLMTAKLETARLLGDLTLEHPKVKSALASQQEIRVHIHGELQSAVAALRAELLLNADRVDDLNHQIAGVNDRMNRLAAVRADYANRVTDVERRDEILSQAQQELSDARASQAAAHSASLITLLDGPSVGDSPIGPGRSMIVLCGLIGGLITGGGILFLTVPVSSPVVDDQSIVTPAPAPQTVRSNLPVSGLSLKQALTRIAQLTPSWN